MSANANDAPVVTLAAVLAERERAATSEAAYRHAMHNLYNAVHERDALDDEMQTLRRNLDEARERAIADCRRALAERDRADRADECAANLRDALASAQAQADDLRCRHDEAAAARDEVRDLLGQAERRAETAEANATDPAETARLLADAIAEAREERENAEAATEALVEAEAERDAARDNARRIAEERDEAWEECDRLRAYIYALVEGYAPHRGRHPAAHTTTTKKERP